ncbi:PrsW family intramembrane metalloprotease [Streptomyces sp. 7-21]|uniref:PrsW family intramembrane metalloprotease n=1 Tax=Streptomyces sp. 7-21 TaxID=2802283 RepID=UPI00191E9F6A|nr:PrsW family intramembrane metalloprotease [Streptomyces sp. 7-21]MBL1065876.1 PrsW family intramembrane metalloprotease [Streptomyces sp. 7-21]
MPSPPLAGGRPRRTLAIGAPLVACALVVLVLVRRETGGDGFAAGLGLAALPVPFLLGVFAWLDGVTRKPWRTLAFSFAWGAGAATLLSLLCNGLLVGALTGREAQLAPLGADALDTLELTVIAPVVEESAKAVAVALLFLCARPWFDGVLAGVTAAGVTATGFAFTENVLYLGSAVAYDVSYERLGLDGGATLAAFFVRVVLAPFAHPMFTAVTGVAIGLAASWRPRGRAGRWGRALLPPLGLAGAMGLHSAWNASTALSLWGFAAVYALLMLPVFASLAWLAAWSRQRELRVVRRVLPAYARAGWLAPDEPRALGSPRGRALARRLARQQHGLAGLRAAVGYQAAAGSVAVLRWRASHGHVPDFAARERELLARLWRHRALAGPATAEAARWGAGPGGGPAARPAGRARAAASAQRDAEPFVAAGVGEQPLPLLGAELAGEVEADQVDAGADVEEVEQPGDREAGGGVGGPAGLADERGVADRPAQ